MTHLDGNVLAGPLSEIFMHDMTAATARCIRCGDVSHLAEADVYDAAPGWCVRCRRCGDVLMMLVRAGDRLRFDMRGISAIEIG